LAYLNLEIGNLQKNSNKKENIIVHKVFKAFLLLQFALALVISVHSLADAKERLREDIVKVRRAQLRTPEDIESAEDAMLEAGKMPVTTKIPFRPALNKLEYKAAKDAASAETENKRSDAKTLNVPITAPTLKDISIEGVNQIEAGGSYPPDTHGAVGGDYFIEVTNQHVDIFNKNTGTLVKSVSLASFFGYTKRDLFDPRCVYDRMRNRWIITAEAFPESDTEQYQFIAISKTSDPLDSFYIYNVDVNIQDKKDFWDFPQLGIDQNAIIMTGNVFLAGIIPKYGRMFVAQKSRLYSGLSIKLKFFSGLKMNVTPPIVLDQSEKTFLVAPPWKGNTITKYTLTYPNNLPTLISSSITVPEYSIPPDAKQPDTSASLDTSDSRFVNASTQYADSLWQVHTVKNGNRPTPEFYEFNTSTDTVTQSGSFYASETSHDWNASIAANTSGDVFVTWSSTDPSAGLNAEIRFSGRRDSDPPGIIPSGNKLFTSSTYYRYANDNPQRWGDYSAVTIDPEDSLTAWIVNEKINSTRTWGSNIGQIGY